MLETRQHEDQADHKPVAQAVLSIMAGHSGLHVTVIIECGFPLRFTTASAPSVSFLRFIGKPWKLEGSSIPALGDACVIVRLLAYLC